MKIRLYPCVCLKALKILKNNALRGKVKGLECRNKYNIKGVIRGEHAENLQPFFIVFITTVKKMMFSVARIRHQKHTNTQIHVFILKTECV